MDNLILSGYLKGEPVSPAVRATIEVRDGCACQKCVGTKGLHVHHMLRKGEPGYDDIANMVIMCYMCHAAWHRVEGTVAFAEWLRRMPASLVEASLRRAHADPTLSAMSLGTSLEALELCWRGLRQCLLDGKREEAMP